MNGNRITAGNVRVQIKGETEVFNVSAGSRCHNLIAGFTVPVKFDPSEVGTTIFLALEDTKANLNIFVSAVLVFFTIVVISSALLLNNKAAQTLNALDLV